MLCSVWPKHILSNQITNAGLEIFGDAGTRLMCWPHVYRNLTKRLSQLKKLNQTLADTVLEDIEFLQWSALNETFSILFDLLEKKFINDVAYSKAEHDELCSFFKYFRTQWGPGSHAYR